MAWHGAYAKASCHKQSIKSDEQSLKALAASVHEDGFIGYNQGTGKDPAAGQPVTFTSVPDFEDYGTGCLLLGAAEYYKLQK